MPTIPSISASIENQSLMVLDPHAKSGIFERGAGNRLRKFTGGFTVVFPYRRNHEKWAFRCWHSQLGNVKHRFETLSVAIQKAKSPYLCDFIYTDKGINVEGNIYPTTRMRWVEGMTIKNYICNNCHNKNLLIELAEKFLHLIKDMHMKSLAHGDLQHGNILVGNDSKLYLVDYDSFYCPELKGETDIITGLKDYQHPSRQNNKFLSEKVDYFSELIIYISILGIAYDPSLCAKYKVADTERMLFAYEDFSDITASQIFHDLVNLNPIFRPLLGSSDISSDAAVM